MPIAVNYGRDRVRFPSPVSVGSRLRASARIESVQARNGGVQAVVQTTVEVEGSARRACVVQSIVRYSS